MKLLLLILFPFFLHSQRKWTDYDTHVHVSGNLTSGISSLIYAKTERNLLSNLAASGIVSLIGLSKEYIYDGLMNKGTKSAIDMEANTKGIMIYFFFNITIVHHVEIKRIEFENYHNLSGRQTK